MSKLVDLGKYRAAIAQRSVVSNEIWTFDEVMCLCGERWIAVYEVNTPLKDLECKSCGDGKVFKTGQDLTIYENKVKNNGI